MSPTRVFFMLFAALAALAGLFGAGASVEGSFTFFCLSLFAFGLGFVLFLLKRHFDEAEAIAAALRHSAEAYR